ncbi:hypothetical protein I79_023652 [Cricetulus griseus]|uniref:Uncharacterized protein n=1 Tax=Cricetulus griseus TaxID=10029 RepID=G3III1_CRIGR|nr:hypothetical protein I79_023652 [Cricetulus griseus]
MGEKENNSPNSHYTWRGSQHGCLLKLQIEMKGFFQTQVSRMSQKHTFSHFVNTQELKVIV